MALLRTPSASQFRLDFYKRCLAWPLCALLVLMMASVLFPRVADAGARETILQEGRQDFEENCVACHAADATGRGKLAEHLLQPPKDLTTIAARSGGEFNFWRIFDIISGEVEVEGHKTFQMPKYSKRMRGDDFKPGYLPSHVRVLELTHYLESIQVKAPQ
jgi:mono/diheme cytochrome c family protein